MFFPGINVRIFFNGIATTSSKSRNDTTRKCPELSPRALNIMYLMLVDTYLATLHSYS